MGTGKESTRGLKQEASRERGIEYIQCRHKMGPLVVERFKQDWGQREEGQEGLGESQLELWMKTFKRTLSL